MLKDLIASIKAQDFPQDQIEILVITEGDSEQAKAIGIRRAQGEICAMFCADNYLVSKHTFASVYKEFTHFPIAATYGRFYHYDKNENSLNRYFSLIGGNDVICFYLGKNDRKPYYEQTDAMDEMMWFRDRLIPSLGCNGTFINRKQWLENSNLDHYYPMDAAVDVIKNSAALFSRRNVADIWHRTSDNLISFLTKRYKYACSLYCDRQDRRWKMVDGAEDYWRLLLFITSTLSIIPAVWISIRGFSKVRDWAWFWHWPVCLGFLITYGLLTCRNVLKRLSLFLRTGDRQYWKSALNPFAPLASPTTRSS